MKLEKSTYKPFGLEAIETASRDEIAALQVKRLKRTLGMFMKTFRPIVRSSTPQA
jgi:hypothetical protein